MSLQRPPGGLLCLLQLNALTRSWQLPYKFGCSESCSTHAFLLEISVISLTCSMSTFYIQALSHKTLKG